MHFIGTETTLKDMLPMMQSFKWKQFFVTSKWMFSRPSDPTSIAIGAGLGKVSGLTGLKTAK